jgi:hypothetical protein
MSNYLNAKLNPIDPIKFNNVIHCLFEDQPIEFYTFRLQDDGCEVLSLSGPISWGSNLINKIQVLQDGLYMEYSSEIDMYNSHTVYLNNNWREFREFGTFENNHEELHHLKAWYEEYKKACESMKWT